MALTKARQRPLIRRLVVVALVAALLATITVVSLVSAATVETTPSGVATRFRIPLGVGDAAFPVFRDPASRASFPGFLDGPIVRSQTDGSWTATWFCEDGVARSSGNGPRLQVDCAGATHVFALGEPRVPDAVAPMPARVAVLSDLEGNAAFLDKALARLAITGADGDWGFGDGHLVVLGDSVDRGRDVFAVLWRLHGLAMQAEAAGGAVHVLLGNHEQYLLRGDPTRANHDHLHALSKMGGHGQAFAAGTVIGDWLRRQPVALKLGTVLFVHGGISPATASTGLSLRELNDAMRGYWNASATAPRSAALDAVLGPTGVTQYRGYFHALEGRYPAATEADVAAVLEHYDATAIVVAHTKVAGVQRLHGGRVYAVDVNDNEALPQVLLFESGTPRIVDIGVPRDLPARDARAFREFSLAVAADRQLLMDMYGDIRRLSAMPYPY